jgi:ATP phosphoribosyltransferase regulatory subunit HisZ
MKSIRVRVYQSALMAPWPVLARTAAAYPRKTGLLGDCRRYVNRTFNVYLKTDLTHVDQSDQTEYANLLQTTDPQQFLTSLDHNVNSLFDTALNTIPQENQEIVNNLPPDEQNAEQEKANVEANAQAFQRKRVSLDSTLDR